MYILSIQLYDKKRDHQVDLAVSFFVACASRCYFSTIVQPDGMLSSPVYYIKSAGHVNVPDAATPDTQLSVAFDGFHEVKSTSIEERLLQPANMY